MALSDMIVKGTSSCTKEEVVEPSAQSRAETPPKNLIGHLFVERLREHVPLVKLLEKDVAQSHIGRASNVLRVDGHALLEDAP